MEELVTSPRVLIFATVWILVPFARIKGMREECILVGYEREKIDEI